MIPLISFIRMTISIGHIKEFNRVNQLKLTKTEFSILEYLIRNMK